MSKRPQKKSAENTLTALLAQGITEDHAQAELLHQTQADLLCSLSVAVQTLTDLLQSADSSAGVKLGAAQALLKSYSSLQRAADDADVKASTMRWQ